MNAGKLSGFLSCTLLSTAQWGHFAKKVERHNFLRRPSESINEVNFLVKIYYLGFKINKSDLPLCPTSR